MGTIAGETIDGIRKTREGTLYFTRKHVFKVFGHRTNPYDILDLYQIAEKAGVPVPATAKFSAEFKNDDGGISWLSGIMMDRISGPYRFFQFSNSGAVIVINNIAIMTDKILLEKAITSLTNAGNAGVSDTQGFISPNQYPPLIFIDIHLTGYENLFLFNDCIKRAKERLESLGFSQK